MTTIADALPPARASARAWWGLAILALPCLLYSMDLTILNLAVPHIAADLGASGPQLLWMVDIYGFVLAGSLVTMGALGDRIGRRRLLLWGAAAFGAASTLAAFASSTEMLIASRALLGLAAATLAPSTLSLISNIFADERQRGFAIGVWIASFALGGAVGPVVGGLLLEQFWWGSVFLVAVPIMVLLLILGPLLLPEFRDPDGARIDLPSAALSMIAILAIVYGIKQLIVGEADAFAFVALAGGILVGSTFVLRQVRLPDPMIDVALLGRAQFLIPLAIYFLGLFLAFGVMLLLAQYLQLVLGQSPLEAGLWTLFSGAGFIAGSLLAPLMAGWLPAQRVVMGSLLLAALGFALLGFGVETSQFPSVLAGAALFSLGVGPVLALSTDLIVGAVPPERSGSAAAVAETASELGGALGIAVAGSMALGSYRGSVAALLPAGLPDVASAAMRDSLGAALVVAGDLPSALAEPSIAAARTAFADAFAQQAFVTAGVAMLAMLLASRLRRT